MESTNIEKSKKGGPSGLLFFILKNLFDLATYALIGYVVIIVIGQIFHLFEVLNWLFVVAVSIITAAYVIRKFLIFLILRKK